MGTYAVLRGAGLGGGGALEDPHVPTGASGPGGAVRADAALLESLLGRSRRLVVTTGGDAGGSMGTALSPSSMLTSSYLTTADLDVVHAQQQDKTAAEAALRGAVAQGLSGEGERALPCGGMCTRRMALPRKKESGLRPRHVGAMSEVEGFETTSSPIPGTAGVVGPCSTQAPHVYSRVPLSSRSTANS